MPLSENPLRHIAHYAVRRLRRFGLSIGLCFYGLAAAAPAGPALSEKPLAPHFSARGKTMFVQLSPEETGVRTENRFADPKMWGELYQEFLFGAVGTGVAIGDYDGDGRPDIFVVSKTESCRLFHNLGNWKFEDVTDRAGVGDKGPDAMIWKQGATFVDINNDGLLDIYVCRFNAPNLLYINQGDGTFKEMAHAYGLDVSDSSGMASFCDYDRDGLLDVYIATNILDLKHPNGQVGYLFHHNRDGTFTNVTAAAGISGESQSHSATWWDYDNDGWPDLYVANDYGVPDKLYHNNRDGTFTETLARVVPHTAFSSMGTDLGDVNNDGLIDFIVADMAATTHEKDQRTSAELREKNTDTPADSGAIPKYRHNALFLNTDTGLFLEAGYLSGVAVTDWTWALRLEDLDNDGRIDLFIANGMNKEENADVNTRMMRAESTAERIRLMRESPLLKENHFAFRNLGDLQFKNVSAEWGLAQKGISFGAAFGDFDGDGNLDLVYSNYQDGVSVLRNDCDVGHRIMIDLRGTVSNRFGIGSTVQIESASGKQIQQLWLARGYMSSSEPVVHFGLGADTLVKRMVVTWPSGIVQVFENLSVDRRFTITEPSTPPPALATGPRVLPDGQFSEVSEVSGLASPSKEDFADETSQQRLLPVRLGRRSPSVAIGELTGEGEENVLIGGTTLTPARLLRRSASGTFTAVDTSALLPLGPVDDGPTLFFDANGDGKNDLLVTRGGNSFPAGSPEYQPLLFLNTGNGKFAPAPDDTLPALPISVGAVAAADFDHDGRLDLFIGGRNSPEQYPSAPRSALLLNRAGKFDDVTDRLAPGLSNVGMVTSALWTDVDNDGWVDLLLTLEWGQVKYFHNKQGTGFEDWTEKAGFASAGTGWWRSIAAADFNGDGRLDYVVGNVGLNTQYHADPQHPALLFSGDFRGNGSSQIIEAYYEGDRLYPWRSRRTLGAAIPSIMKRYPWNDPYAKATLPEILGATKLAAAERFAATEFRSGVFLSQTDGTYRFKPLPNLAQISPLESLVAGDFDGDGHADIYAVQNSYAPIPVVGRFDGGLSQLLRGDGQGNFTPVPVAESRLIVPGDAKAVAVLDLDHDGWPDFLVTRNNGTSLAFRNRGVSGRHSFGIQLRDTGPNRFGIGARITITMTDGSTQTGEIEAGGGPGQSNAAIYFGFLESNPPTTIQVRWPTGVTTQHPFLPNTPRLIFSGPER